MKAKHLWFVLVVCVLLLIPALLATPAQAAESIPEGLEYSISNGEVTITDYTGTATELEIPSEIVGCPVTTIGHWAFSNSGIVSISIPDTIDTIGSCAFAECWDLVDIHITDIKAWCSINYIYMYEVYSPFLFAENLYLNDELVTDLVIPNGVTSIGRYAFAFYDKLISVTIPKSVTNIGGYAFSGCYNLKGVYISELESWCRINYEVLQDDSGDCSAADVTPLYYAKNLYLNGEPIEKLVIPDTIIEINEGAFYNCESIKTVIISNNVTKVGEMAFYGCTNLESITFGKNVTDLGYRAFYNAPTLKTLYFWGSYPILSMNSELPWGDALPEDDFGSYFCECCKDFNSYLPKCIETIYYPGNDDEWNRHISHYYTENPGSKITFIPVYFPEGLQYTINNDEVTITGYTGTAVELEIPSEIDGYPVTTIQSYAFSGCSTLENVTIPESVTYIGERVFEGCTNLKAVWLYCHPDAAIWQIGHPDIFPDDCFCDDYPLCGHGGRWEFGTFAYIGSSSTTSVYISVDYMSLLEIYNENIELCYFGTTEDGLEYRISSEEAVITKYFGTASEFVIPKSILDYPVKSIADCAFSGNTTLKTLVFPGEAPNISPNAFAGAELTIQFPADDASWQNAAIKNYGGTLSWEPYGNPQFTAGSLVLKDNLNIRFSVDAAAFEYGVYNSPKVVFTIGNATQTVDSYTVSEGKYIFVCDNISPSQIGDVVQAELYAIYFDDEVKLQTMEYGVATYCYNMLAKTDDEALCTLLVDLLNYGSAAQKYAGYKTNSLSNSQLTEEQKTWGTAEEPELASVLNTKYQTVKNAKATWKAAGLVLENSVTMRFRFAAESTEGLSVKIIAAGKEWNITEFDPVPGKDGQYYVYFSGLSARQMRESVFVAVYEGSTRVSNTLRYSVETYAYSKLNDTNVKLVDLVKAMMRYGISAENYLN